MKWGVSDARFRRIVLLIGISLDHKKKRQRHFEETGTDQTLSIGDWFALVALRIGSLSTPDVFEHSSITRRGRDLP
jgi:hypothetical protein